MGKRKIPFTIIETAVIRSEQLTWSEKRLYISLKTYRHNSPPTRCDPCLETIEKTSGLSHPTMNKAKKLLEIKGLIKYQSGGGRTKTNKYIFTLEDGTDEEKQILLAYLKAKKTGLEFNKKQGKNEPTNKKYLTRRKPPGKENKKTNPEIKKFIDTYFNDYKKYFNEAPEISGAKDGNLTKQMLTRHSLKNLVSLLPLFWQLKDDLIDKNGHTIGMFKLRFNKLIELKKEKEKRWWKRDSPKPDVVASSKQKEKNQNQ